MDSVTQLTLGAAIGEAVLGKKVGNKAVLWGAVCGTIPDLDVIPAQFMSLASELTLHRGPSHSIAFSVVMAPLLGWLIASLYKGKGADRWDWTKLAFWSLVTHPLLDCFTTWGTQLFWPFSDYRVAIHSIFVIDPLYTLPLLICVIWLTFKRDPAVRKRLNMIGLGLSSLYLGITLVNKSIINHNFEALLEGKNISYLRYHTRPTPMNNILWSANVETQDGFYIVYRSFLDRDDDVPLSYLPKNHHLLAEFEEDPDVQKLLKLTGGYYVVERAGNDLIIKDLRFGQFNGWNSVDGPFVFAYRISGGANGAVARPNMTRQEPDLTVTSGLLSGFGQRILGKLPDQL